MARNLRIITGLILFLFTTGHLINQALGLHSLELMDNWRPTIMAPWTNFIGGPILTISLLSHGLLGMASLYQRNTLKMSSTDMVQFASGFLILPLLAPHVLAIKLGADLIPGYHPTYNLILQYFWVGNPLEGLRQIFVIVAVWIHGAIGLLTWFRLQSWWSFYGKVINPLVVLVPITALLGFVEAGKEVIAASATRSSSTLSPQIIEALNTINTVKWSVIAIYSIMLIAVLVARHLRLRNRNQVANIKYKHGPMIKLPTGLNLLELSIANHVPHANLCRGRGRCGTCQVRIISSENELAGASDLEQATLDRIGAGPDIRLACQLMPSEGELVVERILTPYSDPAELKEFLKGNSVETPTTLETSPEVTT